MGIDYEYAFNALINTIEFEMKLWDEDSNRELNRELDLLEEGDRLGAKVASTNANRSDAMARECAYLLKQAAQFC